MPDEKLTAYRGGKAASPRLDNRLVRGGSLAGGVCCC